MKTSIVTYEHRINGLSLFVVPETDEEREVLKGLWRHGKLEKCNGVADGSGQGFCIHWKLGEESAS